MSAHLGSFRAFWSFLALVEPHRHRQRDSVMTWTCRLVFGTVGSLLVYNEHFRANDPVPFCPRSSIAQLPVLEAVKARYCNYLAPVKMLYTVFPVPNARLSVISYLRKKKMKALGVAITLTPPRSSSDPRKHFISWVNSGLLLARSFADHNPHNHRHRPACPGRGYHQRQAQRRAGQCRRCREAAHRNADDAHGAGRAADRQRHARALCRAG